MLSHKFLIIIPCKNEEKNILKFVEKVLELKKNVQDDFDLCFVDDGSDDETWSKIKNLNKKYHIVKGIKLSKNFGKESAIEAGLNYSNYSYDYYIVIDADLQHPINKISELINIHKKEKFEIVNTHRINAPEGFLREISSGFFYKLLNYFTNINIISKTTDFMLISKKVRNEYIDIFEYDKTFRIMIAWMGYKKKSIPIEIMDRKENISKYNFINLLRLATNAFSSFSILPLKLVGYFGIIMTLISTIMLTFMFLNLIQNFTVISWQTIIIVFQIFLTGIIMISIGISGIYLSKILNNVEKRPSYLVQEKISIEE